MTGFVYAVECAGRVKIGWSAKPYSRLVKIRCDAPFPCSMLALWVGSRADEEAVHLLFSPCRLSGEWFTLDNDLREFLKSKGHIERHIKKTDKHPLAHYLRTHNIRRTEFAERIGVSQSYVTQLYQGQIWPGRDIATKIREVTGGDVGPNDFIEAA